MNLTWTELQVEVGQLWPVSDASFETLRSEGPSCAFPPESLPAMPPADASAGLPWASAFVLPPVAPRPPEPAPPAPILPPESSSDGVPCGDDESWQARIAVEMNSNEMQSARIGQALPDGGSAESPAIRCLTTALRFGP